MEADGGAWRARRSKGAVYHLDLRRGDIPPLVLLPGDPDRASQIADSWEWSRPLSEHREFRSFRGRFRGVELGTVSAGIGGPSVSIVVDELAQLGVRTVIRVGSCGALDPSLRHGDLAITLAAARFERTGEAYAPLGYPAVSDPAVYRALEDSARVLGAPFRTGITATVGTFYPEQDRPGFAGVAGLPLGRPTLGELRRLRILNIEMEMATVLTMARVFGLRAGGVSTVYGESPDGNPKPADSGPAIRVANEAIVRLATSEAPRRLSGQPARDGRRRSRGRRTTTMPSQR
jgi:uridine phosphorylase